MRHIIEVLNKPNRNGRTYSEDSFKDVIEQNNPIFGAIGMWANDLDPSKISHKITDLKVEVIDGETVLTGKATILETEQGNILKGMLENSSIGFRLSGTGTITNTEDGVNITDYQLNSINAVME